MKKSEKIFFVENLSEELKSATSLVLVDYTGLSVKKQQELKKLLKAVSAKLFVAKNTLFKLAANNAKLSEEATSDSVLTGPTAFVITESDPIAPIQVLAKFAQTNEIPQFKIAIIEGKFQDKESLIKLSQLPSKDILYSQVIGAISAPAYNLISILQGNLQKLVWVLDEKSKSPSEIA
jgi:large subunit ribosomal protein L10